jgi:hypothetical protein
VVCEVCEDGGRVKGMSSEDSEYVLTFVWVSLGFIVADAGGCEDADCIGGEGGRCWMRLDWRVARVSRLGSEDLGKKGSRNFTRRGSWGKGAGGNYPKKK